MRVGLIAMAATASALAAIYLPRALRRVALRRKICAQQRVLTALASHAARARALGQAYNDRMVMPCCDAKRLADRLRHLRGVQQRALAGLAAARRDIDHALLLLLRSQASDGDDCVAALAEFVESPQSSASRRRASPALAEEHARLELEAEARLAFSLLDHATASDIVSHEPMSRDAMLREEAEAVDALVDGRRGGAASEASEASEPRPPAVHQPRALRRAVRLLRATEADLGFQAELLRAQIVSAGGLKPLRLAMLLRPRSPTIRPERICRRASL